MKSKLLRNVYATIVALFIALFALPTEMQAQDKYGLWVAGVQVTSENRTGLSNIEGVSGEVRYSPRVRTLYLNNAKIEVKGNGYAIDSEIDGLIIKLIGVNEITAEDGGVGFVRATTITGGGTLNVRSQEECAIYMNGADLTIKHCTVNAIGKDYGIAGSDDYQELLSIERARVTAEGTEKGSIMDIDGLSLKECAILQPAGAKFDKTKGGVVLNGEYVNSKVVIEPTITSRLIIAGKEVTSANCNDLSVIDGVSGTVKYDPVANVLTLQDAKINAKGHSMAIESYMADLKIEVIGTNEVNAKGSAIYAGRKMKITGDGTLNVKSQTFNAIILNGTILEIMGCNVNAIGKKCGITGVLDTNARLHIERATVTAEGSEGSIYGFSDVALYYCYFVQPKNAEFDASLQGVVQKGALITSKIVIMSAFNFPKIAGVWITPENCDDLSTISGVSGTVKYDPFNRVLTLQNAKINVKGKTKVIESSFYGLTIKVIGTNEVNAEFIGLLLDKVATITGDGTLNVNSKNDKAIFVIATSLTIDGCTVNATGREHGLTGYSCDGKELTVRNATVTVEGTEKGSICGFPALNLIGCSITEPVGAKFDPEKKCVVLNGETVKNKVVIKYDPTAIETPIADNRVAEGIYTLSGVRLSGELKDLPKGIYIVNGKKVVKP